MGIIPATESECRRAPPTPARCRGESDCLGVDPQPTCWLPWLPWLFWLCWPFWLGLTLGEAPAGWAACPSSAQAWLASDQFGVQDLRGLGLRVWAASALLRGGLWRGGLRRGGLCPRRP